MGVELAKSAGFCFGVKRAVDLVYEKAAQASCPVYTYGPIIHNAEVVQDLEKKGVHVLDEGTDLSTEDMKQSIIIIRSHGVSEKVQQSMEQTGAKVVDATCPFVKKIHRLVREHSEQGYHIVIIGNPDHPEVQGIRGWCDPEHTDVIGNEEDARKFNRNLEKKVYIVSQTTFNYNKFQYLVEILEKKGYDIVVANTICSATAKRQREARELAGKVDAMLVIGGANSSNTRKLFEICSELCTNTYFLQTKEDLDFSELSRFDCVGITAGASTPNNIIEEVQTECQKILNLNEC